MTSLISIVVPVYNVEQYITRCLESIINQTYKNLEIILVDDGSTDDSYKICEQFARKDKRIQVIHKENSGVSSARNVGLEVSTGKYIGFVDADDYIVPEMYMVLYDAIKNNNVDVVSCNYCFDYGYEVKGAHNTNEVPTRILKREEFLYYVYRRDEYKGVANYVWSKLYKRECLFNDSIGIKFRERYCVGEDIVFNAEVYAHSNTFLYIDKPMYYYVQRQTSVAYDKKVQLNTLSLLDAYQETYKIYEMVDVSRDILDLVRRFYVYWCGKYIEYAKEVNDVEIVSELKERIRKYLQVYIDSNQDYPERVQWILMLLD